jgi:hypothetical protein
MIGEWRIVNMLQQQSRAPATATDNVHASVTATDLRQWQRPCNGWWKCNVYASFLKLQVIWARVGVFVIQTVSLLLQVRICVCINLP